MSTAFRYAWWLLLGSLTCICIAVFFLFTTYWPLGGFFLYGSVLLLWRGWSEKNLHLRRREEDEWWARKEPGVWQPPLNPCCTRFETTHVLHDMARCTRDPVETQEADASLIDSEWQKVSGGS